MSKVKITFVVPEELQHELRQRVANDGYGLRGKSKWVAEAIGSLFDINNYAELVQYNEEMKGFEKMETVVISQEEKLQLEEGIVAIRHKYPTLEGVQSSIVRTAILQRLLRT